MQISSGLISCDPGVDNSLITGNVSVDWTQVTVNSLLIVSGITYVITDVNAGAKTLRISPAWVGAAVSSVAYTIVRDFTLNMSLPLLNPGDLEAAAIYTRAMKILDGVTSAVSTDPNVSDQVIAKTGHGFKVGNVLYINGSNWTLATSVIAATNPIVGVVSKVVDANTFWLRSTGIVGSSLLPFFGISLSAGQIYYLRETPTAVSDGYVNICTGLLADAGSLLVPVLQAETTDRAYILTLAQVTTNVFGANKPGLVPNPGTPSGKILSDGGFINPSGLTDNTIRARHLDPAVPWVTALAGDLDWDNFEAQASNTPLHAFIMDLQTRVKAIETLLLAGSYARSVFTRKSHSGGTWSWTVPAGVKWAQVTVLCGEAYGCTEQTVRYPTQATANRIPIGQGARFRLSLEGITTLSGTIGPYKTVLNYNSVVNICRVGYDASSLTSWWKSPASPLLVPFEFNIQIGARPESSPFAYSPELTRISVPLVSFHFPDRTSAGVASSSYPDLPGLSSTSGYFMMDSSHPGHFSGAVVIETGVLV